MSGTGYEKPEDKPYNPWSEGPGRFDFSKTPFIERPADDPEMERRRADQRNFAAICRGLTEEKPKEKALLPLPVLYRNFKKSVEAVFASLNASFNPHTLTMTAKPASASDMRVWQDRTGYEALLNIGTKYYSLGAGEKTAVSDMGALGAYLHKKERYIAALRDDLIILRALCRQEMAGAGLNKALTELNASLEGLLQGIKAAPGKDSRGR